MKILVTLPLTVLSIFAASNAHSGGVGMGLRVGTLGFGGDVDIALLEKLNVRVGYSTYSYSHTVEDTGVTYDGDLKLSNASLLLDWHPFASGFRMSIGGMGPGLAIDVKGKPTGGNYDIGNGTYTAAQIGSLNGELKFGRSVSPYLGLGWGNVVGKNHRVTFLFDFGAIYAGTPTVNLNATPNCAGITTAQCTTLTNRLQNDVAVEKKDLESNVSEVKWWPVISLGLGVRFK